MGKSITKVKKEDIWPPGEDKHMPKSPKSDMSIKSPTLSPAKSVLSDKIAICKIYLSLLS